MKERIVSGAGDNPGPGDYASEKVKVVATVKDMMSNSFTTKVSIVLLRLIYNLIRFRFQDFVPQPQVQVCMLHLHTSPIQDQELISKV